MPNIIEKIIEIDSIAQKRLSDANLIKDGIKQQVLEKSEQTKQLISEKANARINRINEIEGQYAREQMDKIKDENQLIIEKLEATYQETHKAIEQEIFNSIISNKSVN